MSQDSNIVVCVRVRPFNQREISRGAVNVITMSGPKTTITNPDKPDDSRTFTFDHSYWSFDDSQSRASQGTLMKDIGEQLVENSMEGFNASIFAYGQTGSGKSYSMMGYGEDVGLIPLISNALFARLEAVQSSEKANHSNKVEVSYLEIYNETVRDLLNPSAGKNLKVREHPTLGVFVEDLRTILVTSYKDMEGLIDYGQRTRTVASTAMNATSSRSHSIFSVLVTQTRLAAADDASAAAPLASDVTSKINLVDLAGSERQSSTGAVGDRLKEGCAINKSLSALGNVISALADIADGKGKKKKGKFVPYRDSVLTRLLQQSLGGNSKTAMIAALSPADINYEETLSTLRYADRAKKIVNKATINEEPNERLIRELRAEIERLRALLEAQGSGDGSGQQQQQQQQQQVVADPEVIRERDRLREEMLAQQKLIERMTMSSEARLQSQSEMGLDALLADDPNAEARRGPHLVNLHEDPALTERIAYPLSRDGATTFGKKKAHGDGGKADPDHVMRGLGIAQEHCAIKGSAGGAVLEIVAGSPESAKSTFVNGSAVAAGASTPLRHNDRVVLGVNHYFRVVIPPAGGGGGAPKPAAAVAEDGKTRLDWDYAVEELSRVNGHVPSVGGPDPETIAKMKALEETLAEQQRAAREELERERREASEAATEEASQAFKAREAELAEANRRLEVQLLRAREEEAKRQRKLVLEDNLIRAQTMCVEANSIASEIGRECYFEPKVLTTFDRAGNEAPAAGVRFIDRISGRAAIWDFDKFVTRLYLMREVYGEWQDWEPKDEDEVFGIIPESDPFYDPPGTQLIARTQVLLEALGYGIDVEDNYPLRDHSGRAMGSLAVKIAVTDLDGEEVDCPNDDPQDLLGQRLRFRIELVGCSDIPAAVTGDIFAKYAFREGIVSETESVEAAPDARFGHVEEVEIDMDFETLDRFREDLLAIELYGDQVVDEDADRSGLQASSSAADLNGSKDPASPIGSLILGARRKRAISLSGLSSVFVPDGADSPRRSGSHLSPNAAATGGDPAAAGRIGSSSSARGKSPLAGVFTDEASGGVLSASGRFTTIAEERLLDLEARAARADAIAREGSTGPGDADTVAPTVGSSISSTGSGDADSKEREKVKEVEAARDREAERARTLEKQRAAAIREKEEREAELVKKIAELNRVIEKKDAEIQDLSARASEGNKSKSCAIQ